MTAKTLAKTFTGIAAASLLLSARADITTGLVGYWAFDDGPGTWQANDSTTSANNGMLTGFADYTYNSMWTTNGWFNDAILFNQNGETGNYVAVPHADSLDFGNNTKQFTLAAWVKGQTSGAIICKGTGNGGESYCLDVNGGKFRLFVRNASGGGSVSVSASAGPNSSTWTHVAGTYNISAKKLLIYVNGNQSGSKSTSYTALYKNTHELSIGNRQSGDTDYDSAFKGTIDDVHIYNRALSASDIYELFTNDAPPLTIATQPHSVTCYSNDTAMFSVAVTDRTLPPVSYQWQLDGTDIVGATSTTLVLTNVTDANNGSYTVVVSNPMYTNVSDTATLTVLPLPAADFASGLTAHWLFDDASGSTTAADSSGNGYNGTLAGFNDTSSVWGAGFIGGALTFNSDGTGANVVAVPNVGTPAPAALDFAANPAFTLAAWVNASTAQASGATIIAKGTGDGGEQYVVDIYGGHYRFFVRDANGVVYTASTSVGPAGYYQLLAATLNASNGTMNFYVDGLLAASAVAPVSLLANSHEVSIGNRQPGTDVYGDPLTGAVDDLRIYNRGLTSADVAALYAATAHPQVIAAGSQNYTLYAGASPTFAVTTVGLPPISYQWYANDALLADATNASWTSPGGSIGTLTSYCVVSNPVGTITSAVWTVTFIAPPADTYGTTVLNDNPVAYWRLDEADNQQGNSGAIAYDPVGGHNCAYASTILGQDGYSPVMEPDTAALFGVFAASNSYAGEIDGSYSGVPNIDFAQPAGSDGQFSVEAWVKYTNALPVGGGLVTKGYGSGGEQFDLDLSPGFRFFVRDAAAKTHGPTSSITPVPGTWYHVVGVCDEVNGAVRLYVNGVDVADTTGLASGLGILAAPSGTLASASRLSIGARVSTKAGTYYNTQFSGTIDDVALYNYALSPEQVLAHYQASSVGAGIIGSTPNTFYTNTFTKYPGAGISLSVAASGLPPLTYEWITNGVTVPGTTGTDLVLTDLSLGTLTATCIVNNSFGAATNTWIINVIAPPTPYPQAVAQDQPVAFWRLNEADNGFNNGNTGAFCVDAVGNHDGLYNNTKLSMWPGYDYNFDPNATAAEFGTFKTSDSYVGPIQGLNFAAGSGTNVDFSVEAWVKPAMTQGTASQMVSQGEYGVDDSFELAFTYGSPYNYRFITRNAANTPSTATSNLKPDGNWHHLVGVRDQTHGIEILYIDGVSNCSAAINTASGLYEPANTAVIVGAGTQNGTSYNSQYIGQMSDVAIYDYALTPEQVRDHYSAIGVAPQVSLPSDVYVSQGDTFTVTANVTLGAQPLSYSWTDAYGNVLPDQTNATLVVSNIDTSDYYYTVTVNNAYGTASAAVGVIVVSGAPQIYADVAPLYAWGYAGTLLPYSVTAYGTLPLSYQWSVNGTAIADATNPTYTATAALGTNTYTCTVNNSSGTATSSDAELVGVPAPTSLYAQTVLSNNPIAYWRLDEADDGNGNWWVTAYDYVGQHNATYQNVNLGLAGYNPAADSDTAAEFGVFATSGSYAGEIDNSYYVPTINFAQSMVGGNAEFSVEAWVKAEASQEPEGAGIVAKGYGNGGEQFVLDCHNNQFRFYFVNAKKGVVTCQSPVSVTDGKWHHVVGVCDQLNGTAHIFVDGTDYADIYNGGGNGVVDPSRTYVALPAANLVSIGARASSNTSTTMNNQFIGLVDDVALYDYPLSADQVAAHYTAGAPVVASPTTFTTFYVSGDTFYLGGTGGIANGQYTVLSSTNAALPLADWTPVSTNSFDASGNFSFTEPYSSADQPQFYTIEQQQP